MEGLVKTALVGALNDAGEIETDGDYLYVDDDGVFIDCVLVPDHLPLQARWGHSKVLMPVSGGNQVLVFFPEGADVDQEPVAFPKPYNEEYTPPKHVDGSEWDGKTVLANFGDDPVEIVTEGGVKLNGYQTISDSLTVGGTGALDVALYPGVEELITQVDKMAGVVSTLIGAAILEESVRTTVTGTMTDVTNALSTINAIKTSKIKGVPS